MSGQGIVAQSNLEWFIVREMDEELLVYDLRKQQATSLNPFAAAVWNACDGRRSIDDIARELTQRGIAVGDIRAIELALQMLADAGLVEIVEGQSRQKTRGDRRRFLGTFFGSGAAVAAAIATPAVVTILAPAPAQAASVTCGDCTGQTPLCDPTTGECVQCLIDDNCEEFDYEFCANNKCWGPF